LVIAIKASSGAGAADPLAGEDEPLEPVTEAAAPVMMSQDVEELLQFRREDRKRRVRELFKTGRIDRKRSNSRLAEIDTVQMSMDTKPAGLDAKLAAYEELEARPWKGGAVQLSQDAGIREAAGGPEALSGEDAAARAEAKKTAERYSKGA
jgi:hypothetical protein